MKDFKEMLSIEQRTIIPPSEEHKKNLSSLANQHLSTTVKDCSRKYKPTHTHMQTNTHYWLQMKRVGGSGPCRCVFNDTQKLKAKGANPEQYR